MMSGSTETESAWWQLIMLGYQGLPGNIAAEFDGAFNRVSPQRGIRRSLNSLGQKRETISFIKPVPPAGVCWTALFPRVWNS